eukprot:comp23436_c12_seq2/m.39056 comp23436_c12_seq2/g.39056  ORF comp23436_c12_seq2/g.39056 comp23436_c12_seq2/m.39056 type:complete len:231 (-) comp23436_c12_seq2:110-802(-)
MDALRAQLDELMGKNRNGDVNLPDVKFTDPEVCRNYLMGLCAHDLYTNTKKDLGPCNYIHDEQLKAKYEEAVKKGREFDWDVAFERYLEKLVADLDSDIRRANERLKRTQGDENIASGPEADRLVELSQKIAAALVEAEKKGEEGLVDESRVLMDTAEELKREHRKLEQQIRSESGTSTQKLKVCEACGAYLNLFDSDTRFTDHFEGKIHKGCEQVRLTLKRVKDQRLKK